MAESTANATGRAAAEPIAGPLAERDLPEAEAHLPPGLRDLHRRARPATFWSDRDYVYGRWRAPHVAALGAALEGQLVAPNSRPIGAASASSARSLCAPISGSAA
jgi:hypothetical protein